MPLPAKLKFNEELTDGLLRVIRYELEKRGTVCELPNCARQAVAPYRTDWSMMFVCEDDLARFELVPASQRVRFNKRLSEVMYLGMLRKSFVFMNNASGFELEKLVEDFQRQVATLEKRDGRLAKQARADVKRKLKESQSVIGMPDDALIASRQRNDLRRLRGEPVPGPKPKVPTVNTVPTGQLVGNLPFMIDPAAEASLPFPTFNLL